VLHMCVGATRVCGCYKCVWVLLVCVGELRGFLVVLTTSNSATFVNTRGASHRTGHAGVSIRRALGLRSHESTWLDLPSPSPFVTMGMQYKETKAGQGPIVLAEAQTLVDCKMTEAYAWIMRTERRERTRRALEHGDLAHMLLKERNDHDRTVATIRKTPFRLTNREYSCAPLAY